MKLVICSAVFDLRRRSARPLRPAAAPPRRSPPPPPCSSPTAGCTRSRPLPATCRCGYVCRQIRPRRLRRHDVAAPAPPGPASAPGRTASAPSSCTPPACRRDRCAVPCVSSAPTVIAYGLLPGDVIAADTPSCRPPSARSCPPPPPRRCPRAPPAPPPRTADRRGTAAAPARRATG